MDIQITHKNCNDGFHAYLVAKLAFPKIKCYFAGYDEDFDPELVRDKDVLITDFSFKRAKLLELKAVAKSLTLIDHHKSAMDEVGDLDFCHFDMNHSGAMLTWMKLFPGDRPPRILMYVEDRDLWKHELPYTHQVAAFMMNTTNEEMEDIFNENVEILEAERRQVIIVGTKSDAPNKPQSSNKEAKMIQGIADAGTTYMKLIDYQVQRVCKNHKAVTFMGKTAAIVNASHSHSEIGDYLCKLKNKDGTYKYQMALIWAFEGGPRSKVSMRSSRDNPDAADVSDIATMCGGGGHKHAAGFYTTLGAIESIIAQRWAAPEE